MVERALRDTQHYFQMDTSLYYIILYSIIFYYIILYYVILYDIIILYYIILYYIILYYIILYYYLNICSSSILLGLHISYLGG